MSHSSYLGIDVCKKSLDLASTQTYLGQFDNTAAGHRRLIGQLRQLAPTCVAIEASGGYERALVNALLDADLPVAVVQPGCVRHFAKSLKLYAKTDPIDAQLIARFAQATEPRLTGTPDSDVVRLRALRDRRDQIVEDRVREQNRLETCEDQAIARTIGQNIKRLQKIEEQLDQQIADCIVANEQLKQRDQVLQACKGVGPHLSATLLAHLPELGTVNRQQIAALAGLAPYACESGRWKGKRCIYGGRAAVRSALYMATLSAARFDPVLKSFYQKLLKAGKQNKVARIAVARKLLVKLNTRIANLLNDTQNTPAGTTTT